MIDARVLQSDGIEHSRGRLKYAVRRIAEARVLCCSLEHDGARVAIAEAFNACVLLAEAHASGQQHNGRGEIESAERKPQSIPDIKRDGSHVAHYRRITALRRF